MDLGIRGRAALVTGGSGDLGLATARILAAEGARLAIAARGEDRLRGAAEELARVAGEPVLALRADVSVEGDAARLDELIGGLHAR